MHSNVQRAARRIRLAARIGLVEAIVIALGKVLAASFFLPSLFRKDLGIPESSEIEGIAKFAGFMANLATPLLVALAAIAPIALIIGAGLLMVGHRKATAILGGTVAALALAASATGLVA